MNIQGFQKTTLLDYPKHVAATIFFAGCNFCCPFCHNGDLVLNPPSAAAFSAQEVLDYLKKRSKILDGVCITGGEPLLQKDLPGFLSSIKEIGLKIKIDTNGYRPDILAKLCEQNLVDYIAMDIKGTPKKYPVISGLSNIDIRRIEESVAFIKGSSIPYEFRTTVVKELHSFNDFHEIGTWLKGSEAYYLQPYRESEQVIHPIFSSYSKEELCTIKTLLEEYLSFVEIRALD